MFFFFKNVKNDLKNFYLINMYTYILVYIFLVTHNKHIEYIIIMATNKWVCFTIIFLLFDDKTQKKKTEKIRRSFKKLSSSYLFTQK